jgi:hypothetical protein
MIVYLAALNTVPDRLKFVHIRRTHSLLADSCHKAVLRGGFEVLIVGSWCPLIVFFV